MESKNTKPDQIIVKPFPDYWKVHSRLGLKGKVFIQTKDKEKKQIGFPMDLIIYYLKKRFGND